MVTTDYVTNNRVGESIESLILKKLWRRHGNLGIVPIESMADEYLQATIAMIKRGYDKGGRHVSSDRDAFMPILEKEDRKRGLIPAEDGWDD